MDFKTIRETARTGLIGETALRRMVAQKRVPGFYSGTRFWVDADALRETLAAECRKNAMGKGGEA